MLLGKGRLTNISIHEALNKEVCKLAFDIDCSRAE